MKYQHEFLHQQKCYRIWSVEEAEAGLVLFVATDASSVVSCRLACYRRHQPELILTDETKPLCLRCKHGGFECTGYPDQLPFIHDDPASRLQRQTQSPSRKAVEIPAPTAPLSVLCDDLYFAYLKQELRNGSFLLDGHWPGFAGLEAPDDLSRRCITSFAASFFARGTSNEQARKEGMHLYTDSLKELNHRLSQPHIWPPGQTVLAIAILTLYEVGDEAVKT